MGFDREAIKRCFHLSKEKDILDFLILFQELKTKGHTAEHIQVSLDAFPGSLEKADQFCLHFSSLVEYGFDEQLIKKALVKYENDKEKSLEALLEGSI